MYAEIETQQREAKIPFVPAGWGLPYQKLFDQTDVSGWEMFLLESANNFDNPFQKAMEEIYKQKGWFGLILRDVIRESRGTDNKGRLNIIYISHAGIEREEEHDVWAPKNGWYVPNDDCQKINGIVVPFVPGTIVPFETVESKEEAVERFKKYGLNPDYVSFFYRLDNYENKIFAGRSFDPDVNDGGRFVANLDRLPSNSGRDWVASLPAYKGQEADQEGVMKVSAVTQEII